MMGLLLSDRMKDFRSDVGRSSLFSPLMARSVTIERRLGPPVSSYRYDQPPRNISQRNYESQ